MQKRKQIQLSNKIKISSTARMILILLAISIIALGSGNLIKTLTTKTSLIPEVKELYKYTNKIKTKSDINLRENKYIEEDEILDEQTYISDLISNIDINFDYSYTGTVKAHTKYNYKIEAIMAATYTTNNKTYDILNKVETLKTSEDKEVDEKYFSIGEYININYAKYHEMIKSFKQDMGISANSYLYIRLTVNTITNLDSQEVNNQYVYDYKISIGDKIAIVTYNEEDEKSDSIKYEIVTEENKREIKLKDIIISIALMAIGAFLLRFILKKTEELKSLKNEFKLELNRIMRSCESKLVEIEDLKQVDLTTATRVKDISQLLKLSDEALVPIYCYIKEEPEQEAYFIVTKYEKSYIFILR